MSISSNAARHVRARDSNARGRGCGHGLSSPPTVSRRDSLRRTAPTSVSAASSMIC